MIGIELPDRFMKLEAVLGVVACCKTQWYSLVRKGQAPPPIKRGRSSVWRASDIARWIDGQIEAAGRKAA